MQSTLQSHQRTWDGSRGHLACRAASSGGGDHRGTPGRGEVGGVGEGWRGVGEELGGEVRAVLYSPCEDTHPRVA